jgi:hypothetical protein
VIRWLRNGINARLRRTTSNASSSLSAVNANRCSVVVREIVAAELGINLITGRGEHRVKRFGIGRR